jgi:hypothetical protein
MCTSPILSYFIKYITSERAQESGKIVCTSPISSNILPQNASNNLVKS